MRLGIFPRLIIGYLIVSVLVIAVSFYAISQLHRFSQDIRYILEAENRIIDYEKMLTDSLLSQIRYERKFILLRDETLYEQFLLTKDNFERYFGEVVYIADAPDERELLNRISGYYKLYLSLLDEEVRYIRSGQPYPQDWYKQEKDRATDEILKELKNLRVYPQQYTHKEIRRLGKAGDIALRIAIALGVIALLLGSLVSFFIARSISRPLSALIAKTKEISEGTFTGDLSLSSPPEIRKLSWSFNSMCERLKTVDKMKSDFFSYMSHELRTPLTSIKEGANLLLDGVGGEVSEKQGRISTIIAEESDRLIDLVNSMLDLSRMEAGMMPLNLGTASVAPLIDRAITEIEPLALAKDIDIRVEHIPDIPYVQLDSERILQVLRNLIGNAVKFTPDGGVVSVFSRVTDGNLEVSVMDTGPGIEEENLTTIFEKFQQGPNTGPYNNKGTGLGLAIVRHIITEHRGRVWANSEPGQGSTFTFALPL